MILSSDSRVYRLGRHDQANHREVVSLSGYGKYSPMLARLSHGMGQGRAPFPDSQTTVPPFEDPKPRPCQGSRPALHAFLTWLPVHGAAAAGVMNTGPVRKSPDRSDQGPESKKTAVNSPSRCHCSGQAAISVQLNSSVSRSLA